MESKTRNIQNVVWCELELGLASSTRGRSNPKARSEIMRMCVRRDSCCAPLYSNNALIFSSFITSYTCIMHTKNEHSGSKRVEQAAMAACSQIQRVRAHTHTRITYSIPLEWKMHHGLNAMPSLPSIHETSAGETGEKTRNNELLLNYGLRQITLFILCI